MIWIFNALMDIKMDDFKNKKIYDLNFFSFFIFAYIFFSLIFIIELNKIYSDGIQFSHLFPSIINHFTKSNKKGDSMISSSSSSISAIWLIFHWFKSYKLSYFVLACRNVHIMRLLLNCNHEIAFNFQW